MKTLTALVLAGTYYSAGLALIGPTQANLQASCHGLMDTRQQLTSPLVWPVTYGGSLNLENRC
jgi:hypothetical protein